MKTNRSTEAKRLRQRYTAVLAGLAVVNGLCKLSLFLTGLRMATTSAARIFPIMSGCHRLTATAPLDLFIIMKRQVVAAQFLLDVCVPSEYSFRMAIPISAIEYRASTYGTRNL